MIHRSVPFIFLTIISLALSGRFSYAQMPVTNVKSFYFPYAKFHQSHVYQFINQLPPHDTAYWEMNSTLKGSDTFLHTKIYSGKVLREEVSEKMGSNYAAMTSYKVYRYSEEETFESLCAITKDTVFKWSLSPVPYHWTVSYSGSDIAADVTVSKFRQFDSTQKRIALRKISYPCVAFQDSFQVSVKRYKENKVVEYGYTMQSYYVKDIGLVRYRLVYPDGKVADFRLQQVKITPDSR